MKHTTIRTTLAVAGVALAMRAGAAEAVASAGAPETELGKLAASLQPGEMKSLPTRNYNWDLLTSHYAWETNITGAHAGYQIICYANDADWDPVTRQVFYFGLGHYASPKFVAYSAVSNEWRLLELPPWADKRTRADKQWPVGHSYDRMGLSPEHRLYCVNWFGLQMYNIDSNTWSRAPNAGSGGKDAFQVCEYFPEMKGFVYEANWGKQLMFWDADKKSSRPLGSHRFGIHGVMEYNPVHRVMLFGGGDGANDTGNPNLYLLDAAGKVKKLKPAPVWIRCTPDSQAVCDPVSGEYLVQGRGAKHMYAYHPLRDEWRELTLRAPSGLAVRIDEYGVILFCPRVQNFSGAKPHSLMVYKHKPQWPAENDMTVPKEQVSAEQ